ncbi:hypothetical protein L1049_007791 [Liquidambar formosana]|uniref:Uncharacterized protein n=1 Tax=Liquidambar formosana TaxID=63359 RepID=A0AAP0S5E6_LIQFO
MHDKLYLPVMKALRWVVVLISGEEETVTRGWLTGVTLLAGDGGRQETGSRPLKIVVLRGFYGNRGRNLDGVGEFYSMFYG